MYSLSYSNTFVKITYKSTWCTVNGTTLLMGKMKYHTIINAHKNVDTSYNFNIFCIIISKAVE